MKKIISILGLLFVTIVAHAAPDCVTNVILSSLQPGGFSVSGAPPYETHLDGRIEGLSLLSVDCDLGPTITLPIDYSDKSSKAAVLSWECTPQCGPGDSRVITAPARAASITFRIFISGQCQLS